MFNLIRRDVILQKKQLLLFVPFTLFFVLLGKQNPAFIFLLASLFVPINTFAYDEKVEVNILLNSLPYKRSEIIASRYLGAIVYMLLATGVTCGLFYALSRPFSITDIAISSGLFLLFTALFFPVSYVIKKGYVFPVAMISFLALSIIGPKIVFHFADDLKVITDFVTSLSTPIFYIGLTLSILIIYVVSWMITTFIYQRKVF
jgi:ABC-2 type transport system permease protein